MQYYSFVDLDQEPFIMSFTTYCFISIKHAVANTPFLIDLQLEDDIDNDMPCSPS